MATKPHISSKEVGDFQRIVFEYYAAHARALPWRIVDESGNIDPYCVTVSEVMLQQTQVKRVEQKYVEFMSVFPTMQALAGASFPDVLRVWSGLGYNRRAKYLHDFAKASKDEFFPTTIEGLSTHKGIGPNTAAAILVYAFDQRHCFIETNIRTVFIHHFLRHHEKVSDKEILQLVEVTLPSGSLREWYWALMDYGTSLKREGSSHLQKAVAHKKQSAFEGSMRQLRSRIMKYLLRHTKANPEALREFAQDDRCEQALTGLLKDGLIRYQDGDYYLNE